MSEQKAGTTERAAADEITSAVQDDILDRCLHTLAEIDASDGVSKVNVKEFDISLEELG
ncbi:hypothetical protein [Vibrio diabolicus]|uniref:hypothetical protein n=2 Tax=Vibrionaceae TaxID=641 RepID=UPI00277D1337|nr:hypothetical protein [Vibrio diabolicus]